MYRVNNGAYSSGTAYLPTPRPPWGPTTFVPMATSSCKATVMSLRRGAAVSPLYVYLYRVLQSNMDVYCNKIIS